MTRRISVRTRDKVHRTCAAGMLTLAILAVTTAVGCSDRARRDATSLAPSPAAPPQAQPQEREGTPQAEKPPLTGTEAKEPVPAGQQVAIPTTAEELEARLKEKNPLLATKIKAEVVDGKIVGVEIHDENLRDVSPLAGLPLRFLDLAGCPIEDLYPLRGMALEVVYLERTRMEDLRPLAGMPIVELRLNETPVEDIRPLKGMPLRRLYLARTRVRDISPLAGCVTLDSLWLNDTPIEDIRPLASCPNLVSLTLAGTQVADLSPLKGLRLERLHIARTPVEDLTPLAWLRLTRLVFSPGRIKAGLEVVRNMQSLREIGTAFGEEDRGLESNLMPPHVFWQEFDAGRIPME